MEAIRKRTTLGSGVPEKLLRDGGAALEIESDEFVVNIRNDEEWPFK